jgi:hypothetical protein
MIILEYLLNAFVRPPEVRRAKAFLSGLRERTVIPPEPVPAFEEVQRLADSLIPAPRKTPDFTSKLEFTPDYEELWDSRGWPVFEYGQFKLKMPKHKKLNAEFLTPAFTVQKCPMWTNNRAEDTFPIGAKCHVPGFSAPRARIAGELYLVPTQSIPFLDTHYRNGVEFERKSVKLIVPTLNERGDPTELRAFMYVGKKDYWKPAIDWDMHYYHGDGDISLIKPYRDNDQRLNWHTNFTKENFKEGKDQCFMYITDDWPPGRKQAA